MKFGQLLRQHFGDIYEQAFRYSTRKEVLKQIPLWDDGQKRKDSKSKDTRAPVFLLRN
jgi:hypothetical protein